MGKLIIKSFSFLTLQLQKKKNQYIIRKKLQISTSFIYGELHFECRARARELSQFVRAHAHTTNSHFIAHTPRQRSRIDRMTERVAPAHRTTATLFFSPHKLVNYKIYMQLSNKMLKTLQKKT